MRKYKIVYLKNDFYDMIQFYPSIASLLYRKQNDIFDTKQVELLFTPLNSVKRKVLELLQDREDYKYFHGVHHIKNEITDEDIEILFNEYDIEVNELEGKHVIYDIVRSFSKNFYIIDFTN